MSARVLVETLHTPRDARGFVFEPLGPDALSAQRNVHVVVSVPGAVRGNHRHPRATEVLIVVGPALVRTRDDVTTTDVDVPEGAVMRFTIPPGVAHAVKNTGTVASVLVSFGTVAYDSAKPDLERVDVL